MKKILTLLLTGLILLSPFAHSEGGFSSSKFGFLKSEPELMPVNEAFNFDAKQQDSLVKISWVIADGYYMYRDKFKFEASNATLGEIVLPRGTMHQDDYFGVA